MLIFYSFPNLLTEPSLPSPLSPPSQSPQYTSTRVLFKKSNKKTQSSHSSILRPSVAPIAIGRNSQLLSLTLYASKFSLSRPTSHLLLQFNSNSRSSLNTLCPLIYGLLLKLNISHIKPFLFSVFIKNPTFLQGSPQMSLLPGSLSGFPQPVGKGFPSLCSLGFLCLSHHTQHTQPHVTSV